ncbi:aminotransferase class I/II-fold pyridoxal phosphate-dependent enzyme [Actinomadura sp. KC06]|uniref:DegT/DnrJ/EryC1/StrS family aminotransferase n=1 Tax=Actinomadura sp. KC06 TaxID=2530369 RepID=UPI00104CFE61|nr:aminotransferase class I/II-fold pyridoxal phosphate-dependent enzyme [Actinomadura sp. KC06]TDD31226.1 aminotransferase class I/II-fold pyridoxal phosphate-dependent enzyme [Actinomadura sp. KC06]
MNAEPQDPSSRIGQPATASAAERLGPVLARMPDPFANQQVNAFQDELAAAYDTRYAVAVSSGTAALHTALVAADVGPGDEVLVPACTVVMTVAAIALSGARPVFVDAAETGEPLALDDLTAKITDRTRAILPVHLAGRTAGLLDVIDLAERHDLRVIEDACQAHGSRNNGKLAGTLGAAGCFSLKDGKITSCGEGGFLLTDDPLLAARAASFRSHWQNAAPGEPPGSRLGTNYRLAEPLAAIARASLAQMTNAVARRRHQTSLLTDLVGHLDDLETIDADPCEEPNGHSALWRLHLPDPRRFCQRLADAGVTNSVGTHGLRAAPDHPACQQFHPAPCPRASRAVETALAVPVTARDSDEHIAELAAIIRKEATAWAP